MSEEEIVKYVVVTNDSVIIDRNFYNNVLLPCMDKGVEIKNILTEFEKWIDEKNMTDLDENYTVVRLADIKDKLQELKEGKNETNNNI